MAVVNIVHANFVMKKITLSWYLKGFHQYSVKDLSKVMRLMIVCECLVIDFGEI